MRRALRLWVVAALAAAPAMACGARDEVTRLTFSGSALGPEAAVVRRQLIRFSERHPGVDVQLRVTPDAAEVQSQSGDVYLLCSDGLTGMVPEDEILRVVSESDNDLEKACQSLIDIANERGGLDNVTAILVKTI